MSTVKQFRVTFQRTHGGPVLTWSNVNATSAAHAIARAAAEMAKAQYPVVSITATEF